MVFFGCLLFYYLVSKTLLGLSGCDIRGINTCFHTQKQVQTWPGCCTRPKRNRGNILIFRVLLLHACFVLKGRRVVIMAFHTCLDSLKSKKKMEFIVAHLKQDRAGSKKELGVFVVGDWHGCSNRCGFTGVKVSVVQFLPFWEFFTLFASDSRNEEFRSSVGELTGWW